MILIRWITLLSNNSVFFQIIDWEEHHHIQKNYLMTFIELIISKWTRKQSEKRIKTSIKNDGGGEVVRFFSVLHFDCVWICQVLSSCFSLLFIFWNDQIECETSGSKRVSGIISIIFTLKLSPLSPSVWFDFQFNFSFILLSNFFIICCHE